MWFNYYILHGWFMFVRAHSAYSVLFLPTVSSYMYKVFQISIDNTIEFWFFVKIFFRPDSSWRIVDGDQLYYAEYRSCFKTILTIRADRPFQCTSRWTPCTLEWASNVSVTESSRDFNLPAHSFLSLFPSLFTRRDILCVQYWNLISTEDTLWCMAMCMKKFFQSLHQSDVEMRKTKV